MKYPKSLCAVYLPKLIFKLFWVFLFNYPLDKEKQIYYFFLNRVSQNKYVRWNVNETTIRKSKHCFLLISLSEKVAAIHFYCYLSFKVSGWIKPFVGNNIPQENKENICRVLAIAWSFHSPVLSRSPHFPPRIYFICRKQRKDGRKAGREGQREGRREGREGERASKLS